MLDRGTEISSKSYAIIPYSIKYEQSKSDIKIFASEQILKLLLECFVKNKVKLNESHKTVI